ncbi:MAG: DEAD/DEAH box helicase [Myxococcales bacterium SG8_38_1]|jgi:superfamily II RNA helicase|nr:MAG: DEAD/DEAH box helicase [Myxococcales bacterium SG8_38_1]
MSSLDRYLDDLDTNVDGDTLLTRFLEYTTDQGLELYAAQEEAIMELFVGNNVILNTPTGSGKSLVALAAHFRSVALGERSFYTAPIKALVSEKFFDLCRVLGPHRVGMMTGDATVNRDAPVICCTAEILSNLALREGDRAEVDGVVMDEFHYYADRDRGVAWQIPLLTLPRARFLLMSATLGETKKFEDALTELTGAPTTLVKSEERPVPLDFSYSEETLQNAVVELIENGKAPIYVVHFAQRAATEQAQSFMSIDFLSKEEKRAIKEELSGTRFDTPFGKELKKFLHHGIGVHHAGMLPRYRRLVERLAQDGKLRLICGTDTLGVGVNVPIRTVLFTKLCKYDGEKTKVLSVRDFKQIAGRAGRRGFDTLGSVVAQAPEHAIENKKLRMKAGDDAKKLRKLKMRQPPERGYAHWDADTFTRLQESPPEPLSSRFRVSNAMILNLFEREDNGCIALRRLIRASHESTKEKYQHGREAIAMIRSLRDAGVIELDGDGPRVNEDFQSDFSLNQALSLYVVEAVEVLDPEDAAYSLDVLTLVEATLEDPWAVLYRQTDALKSRAIATMKAEGMEYDERMAELDKIEYPKPNAEFLYATYEVFAERHPWVGGDVLRPKSIARDMYELGMSFVEYVKEYGLQRSEGVLLRYLTDAYKGFVQTVPESAKTDELYDVSDWLGLVVRSVDASLLDEWEQLQSPEDDVVMPVERKEDDAVDITKDARGFTTMVRNAVWKIVRYLAFKQYDRAAEALSEADANNKWSAERFAEALAPYWAEYAAIDIGPEARSASQLQIERGEHEWQLTQILLDPNADRSWHMRFDVDLDASRNAAQPVLSLHALGD